MSKNSVRRSNYWASIVYPESAPSDWLTILSDFKIRCFVSPLHDLDVTSDGELKKPHYHILFLYDSLKSESQVKEAFNLIGGVGCERVSSLRGYARYLCHLDDPDKRQYDISLVKAFGGCDYDFTINSVIDKYALAKEMMVFCRDNHIFSYSDLVDYAIDHRSDWFIALHDTSTLMIKEYLKGLHWKCYHSKGSGNE